VALRDLYLRTIQLVAEQVPDPADPYPWQLPVVQALDELKLTTPVTMFVGENGSGKSTLMEAIAIALGLNPEGGTQNFVFETRATHASLHEALRLGRGAQRPQTSYFLRAESMYAVATQIEKYVEEEGGSPALLDSYGGRSLHDQSHGESFLALVNHRLGDRGLYLMDEPESALSPQGLLALMRRIHDLVQADSQLLIATHSPMLLAYPGATIYEIDPSGITEVDYRDTDHYRLTLSFLEAPERFLGRLFAEDG
jgi:predicted ATPase